MIPGRRSKRVRITGLTLAAALVVGAGPAGAGFNEDGKLDAVFGGLRDRDLVCLGDGTGDLSDCSDVSDDAIVSNDVAVGDMDGDGHLDAVFAGGRVCLGNGTGDLSDCRDNAIGGGGNLLALGDVNGDGNLDAVFASFRARSRVCLGDGTGDLSDCSDVSDDQNGSPGGALGDVDGDGNLDAVFAAYGAVPNQVCLGNGDGTFGGFGAQQDECGGVKDDSCDEIFECGAVAVALGYVDGDGNLDAVFILENAGFAQTPHRVCLGDGTGDFQCSDLASDLQSDADAVALGDVDGDGNLDAVIVNINIASELCLGDGTGDFKCSLIVGSYSDSTTDVALGDVDGDGNLDAVFAVPPFLDGRNQVCLGDGTNLDHCSDISDDEEYSSSVALTDSDLDGVQDNADECLPSDVRPTVWINGDRTEVDNEPTDTIVPTLFESTFGCTVADLVQETAATATGRGGFVRDLQRVLRPAGPRPDADPQRRPDAARRRDPRPSTLNNRRNERKATTILNHDVIGGRWWAAAAVLLLVGSPQRHCPDLVTFSRRGCAAPPHGDVPGGRGQRDRAHRRRGRP